MSENLDLNQVSEAEFLRNMLTKVQRHLSNLENTSAMMGNGHFIDAFNRISGSKEGLFAMKMVLEERIASRQEPK